MNKEDAISQLVDRLEQANLVDKEFKQSVLDREQIFPTGLPTCPYGIAIPHADPEHVIESQVAFCSLKTPVKFQTMGSSGEEMDVSIIFLLALKNGKDHILMLQKLVDVFQDPFIVEQLARCKNQNDLELILKKVTFV